MVTWFYFIVFLLTLIMAGSILLRNKNVDTLLVLFSIVVTINCMGRYMLASAESIEMAIWANKFLYVGGCFAPLLTVFVLAKLCNQKLSPIVATVMILYSVIVTCLVMTIGKSGIYYKHVELAYGNGYHYLVKTYGPLHILYPLMMLLYAAIMIYYLLYAISRRKQLSIRIVTTLSITCFSIIIMYILERSLHINVSFLSVGYLIGISLLIKYFERVNMFDMSSNVVAAMEKIKEYGYIVFDNKYRYISANDYMKEIFPEIKNWEVDHVIPKTDSELYKDVVQKLYQWNETEENKKTIQIGEQFFRLDIREISYSKKGKVGYLVELTDQTLEKKYYQTIEQYNANLEKEVEEKTENIIHIKDMMVLGMADMVESRDNNTGGHIKRTSSVVKVFSARLKKHCDVLGISNDFLSQVEKAAPMHDLGKIAIDDEILRKPGKYTEEEYAQMKKHAEEGARIVENILQGVEEYSFVEIAKNVAHYHHEKWNGKGYPEGLSGTDIPVEARIMALADVFDALVSKRCYKEAFSYDKAFAIIKESMGEHFDPELGRIFLECRSDLEALYDGYLCGSNK